MHTHKLIIALLFCSQLCSQAARAGFSASYDKSESASNTSLSYDHAFPTPAVAAQPGNPQLEQSTSTRTHLSDFGFSYDQFQILATDSFTGNSVNQITSTYGGWFGLSFPSDYYLMVSGAYSSTPSERLSTTGLAIQASKWFPQTDTNLGFRIAGSGSSQTLTTTGLRRRLEITSENRIQQRSFGVFLAQGLTSWWRANIRGNTYAYDRDLNDFLLSVNANYLRSLALGGLANSVSSFPKSDASLGSTFSILESWSIDVRSSWTTLVVGNALWISQSFFITKEFNEIASIGIGMKQSSSEGSSLQTHLFSLELGSW